MNKNKEPRRANDNYPTPLPLAMEGWKLAQRYSLQHHSVIEIGCGDTQPFLQCALQTGGDDAVFVGLDVRRIGAVHDRIIMLEHDLTTMPHTAFGSDRGSYDVVIANPPFNLASAFAIQAMQLVSRVGCVVFLCRQSWHCPGRVREQFWADHPPVHVSTITPRPSFSGNGKTDGCEYAYYVWATWMEHARRQTLCPDLQTTLGWTRWIKPAKARNG